MSAIFNGMNLGNIFNLTVKIVIVLTSGGYWINVYKVLGRTSFSKYFEGVSYYF